MGVSWLGFEMGCVRDGDGNGMCGGAREIEWVNYILGGLYAVTHRNISLHSQQPKKRLYSHLKVDIIRYSAPPPSITSLTNNPPPSLPPHTSSGSPMPQVILHNLLPISALNHQKIDQRPREVKTSPTECQYKKHTPRMHHAPVPRNKTPKLFICIPTHEKTKQEKEETEACRMVPTQYGAEVEKPHTVSPPHPHPSARPSPTPPP